MLGRQRRSLSKLPLPARRISTNSVSINAQVAGEADCELGFSLSLKRVDYASNVLNELFLDGEYLGQSQRIRMLVPARSAVCRRGDDFYNPHVQVSGCRERHRLPRLL
jgi:hypothetical protein